MGSDTSVHSIRAAREQPCYDLTSLDEILDLDDQVEGFIYHPYLLLVSSDPDSLGKSLYLSGPLFVHL
jgi:hypothetical protein